MQRIVASVLSREGPGEGWRARLSCGLLGLSGSADKDKRPSLDRRGPAGPDAQQPSLASCLPRFPQTKDVLKCLR